MGSGSRVQLRPRCLRSASEEDPKISPSLNNAPSNTTVSDQLGNVEVWILVCSVDAVGLRMKRAVCRSLNNFKHYGNRYLVSLHSHGIGFPNRPENDMNSCLIPRNSAIMRALDA